MRVDVKALVEESLLNTENILTEILVQKRKIADELDFQPFYFHKESIRNFKMLFILHPTTNPLSFSIFIILCFFLKLEPLNITHTLWIETLILKTMISS